MTEPTAADRNLGAAAFSAATNRSADEAIGIIASALASAREEGRQEVLPVVERIARQRAAHELRAAAADAETGRHDGWYWTNDQLRRRADQLENNDT